MMSVHLTRTRQSGDAADPLHLPPSPPRSHCNGRDGDDRPSLGELLRRKFAEPPSERAKAIGEDLRRRLVQPPTPRQLQRRAAIGAELRRRLEGHVVRSVVTVTPESCPDEAAALLLHRISEQAGKEVQS
ncbi:MAG: hypothetical protein J7605_02770 [Variovorax sp.]|nr:hypothetical protein [Variovorax sp.]